MLEMNKTRLYISKYNELEELARDYHKIPKGFSVLSRIEGMWEYRHIKHELGYCREVRNFLQHDKLPSEFLIIPSDDMLSFLDRLINKMKNPPRCKNHAIPRERIYSASINDHILPVMEEMRANSYTHIPILDNSIVLGVFSENTLFNYILDNGIVDIDKNTRFADIAPYLNIENRRNESFRFFPWDGRVAEVKLLFEEALARGDRIGMVFLTSNGRSSERLMGIITPWDILGNQIFI